MLVFFFNRPLYQSTSFFPLQGYRTGYPYRCPALREKSKKYSDVEIPPSATGYSYAEDSDSGARSPLKHSFQRGQRDKTRWLNTGRPDETPDEGLEGSGSPKAKTKVWTNITHDHVKPLLQSLSSGVCVPSCITNCLVCAYLIVHSLEPYCYGTVVSWLAPRQQTYLFFLLRTCLLFVLLSLSC